MLTALSPFRDSSYIDAQALANKESLVQWLILILSVLCVTFNGLLAIVNANIFDLGPVHVITSEALLLALGGFVIFLTGLRDNDIPFICFALGYLILVLLLSMLNQSIFPDPLRNIAIIVIFFMLGSRANFDTIRNAMYVICTIIIVVLGVEALDTPTYVSWFEPAKYYEATRGLEDSPFNDTGLFSNSLGFESRFSFGLLDHRASSVFLEQVSLANFSIVLMLMLCAFWGKLTLLARTFFVFSIVAFVVTTDSRSAIGIAALALAGYHLFPRIPAFGTILVMPASLVLSFLTVKVVGASAGDDIIGRISLTMHTLGELTLGDMFGLNALMAASFGDSGYTYIIHSMTIFGLLALWLLFAVSIPGVNVPQRRFAFLLNAVLAALLVIGGTAIFSMKVASLIWLLAGFVRQWPFAEEERDRDCIQGNGIEAAH